MKTKRYFSLASSFLVLLLAVLGCEDAVYDESVNAVYIAKSENSITDKVVIGEVDKDYFFTVRLGDKHSSDVVVNMNVDPTIIEEYNKKNGTNLEALPSEYFSLLNEKVTVKAGGINSEPIGVKIKTLGKELPESTKYAIPVTISNVEGDVPVLEASRSLVLVLQRIMITSVAQFGNGSAGIELPKKYACDAWSAEFRIRVDEFYKNNQAVFWAYPTEIYSRFGDVVIGKDQFQIKGVNTQINSEVHFAPKTWYHFAMVFDGATFRFYVNGEVDMNIGAEVGKIYNIDKLGFGSFRGQMSEMRFYNTALTQTQIKDNMYAIDPSTKGLVGYWRLNEGEGDVLHDLSGNGYDITVPGMQWVNNVRVPDVQ